MKQNTVGWQKWCGSGAAALLFMTGAVLLMLGGRMAMGSVLLILTVLASAGLVFYYRRSIQRLVDQENIGGSGCGGKSAAEHPQESER